MITPEEVYENPELMIKYKDDLKEVKIFKDPWRDVFHKHPYLYREFSDRFDEMDRVGVACAILDDPTLILELKDHLYKLTGKNISYVLKHDPTLVLGLKNYLHKIDEVGVDWLLYFHPNLSLYLKYRDDVDKIEAAYYIRYSQELDDLNKEEKREISKKIIEFLGKEKI